MEEVNMKIEIPDLIAGNGIHVMNTYGSNTTISISPLFIENMALDIVKREMEVVRREHPEINFNKIQQMLLGDYEMRQLAITQLISITKYTGDILSHPGMCSLKNIVTEYTNKNIYNITDQIL